MQKTLTHWKRSRCWERLKAGGEGMTEDENVGRHHRLDGHQFEQALEFVKPGVLQFMGSQRVGHDLGNEQQQVELSSLNMPFVQQPSPSPREYWHM